MLETRDEECPRALLQNDTEPRKTRVKCQDPNANTPMQTPSHSGLKVYMELMAFTKHSKYAAVYRLLALIFYAYNVLLVARVCDPTGNCYFLHTALQTKRTKSNLTFLYSAANHSSDISKLTVS